jgi:hypothetical protein
MLTQSVPHLEATVDFIHAQQRGPFYASQTARTFTFLSRLIKHSITPVVTGSQQRQNTGLQIPSNTALDRQIKILFRSSFSIFAMLRLTFSVQDALTRAISQSARVATRRIRTVIP